MIVAVLVGLTGPATLPALASPDAHRAATATKKVLADDFRWCKFSAGSCTTADENHRTRVVVGTRVKWIYNDSECDAISFCPGHNVKFAHHRKSADVKTDGAVITSKVFNSVGRFSYWCTNHKDQGMTGRVVVVAG
jgi:plastocyanin